MYNREIVAKNIEGYYRSTGTRLIEYPIDQVRYYVEHFDKLTARDPKKGTVTGFKRTLTPDEVAFIKNEQQMCRLDLSYEIARYEFVEDVISARLNLMTLNKAQQIALKIIGDMEKRGVPIMLLFLKARQLGVSTLFAKIIKHRMEFVPFTKGVVASGDEEKTRSLVEKMIEKPHGMLPWWLVRHDVEFKHSGDEFMIIPSADSLLIVQHGRQELGIARGSTANTWHFCLAPEVLIHSNNGKLVPIKDIQTGDTIIVSNGEQAKVKACIKSLRAAEEGVAIETWSSAKAHLLTVSKDHPVLTPNGYVDAGKLTTEDYIVQPVRKITDEVASIEIISRPVGASRYGVTIKREYKVTGDLGWFVGLYLAEGTVVCNAPYRDSQKRAAYVVLSLHQKEIESVGARLKELFPDISQRTQANRNSLCVNLILQDNGLAEWVLNNLGSAKTKHYPDKCFTYGKNFNYGVFVGYLEGDGYVDKKINVIKIASVREDLVLQMRDILAGLGLGWSGLVSVAGGDRYGRNCQERWDLQITGQTARNVKQCLGLPQTPIIKSFGDRWMWLEDGSIAVKIRKIEAVWIDEFWSLEVDHDLHNFATLHGSVSNTELLEWPDPKSLIEAGFNKAIHPSARTFGVEETTAGNRGSWLHRHWEECSTDYPEGRSNIFPVFLPYFVGDDIYPPPGYFPITESWEAPDFVKAHAESCERYVHTSPVLSEVLGANWKLSRDQQWWFYNEYTKAIKDPESFANFLAETPSDPRSAFQSRSRSVISAPKLQELQAAMNPLFTSPLWISGPEVPEASTPPSREKSVLKVTYESRGLYRQWELHPAEFTNVEECMQWQHRLWVWEPPKENHRYVVAVDCGGGVGLDRTAIQVMRIGNASMPAVQVAEWASDQASAFDVVGLVLMLLTWYSPMSVTGERNWAMAAPEDAADGKTIIHELRKWGWSNIYVRQTPENRARGIKDGSLLGWHTDQGNRLTLINWFLKFVKEGRLQLNSPWLLDELRTFVRTEKKSMTSSAVTYKVQHDYDSYDDLIFSMAIAIVCGHQIDIYDDVANSQWSAVAQALEKQMEVPKHSFIYKVQLDGIPEPKESVIVKQKPLRELQF